jgi:hypothetical protein
MIPELGRDDVLRDWLLDPLSFGATGTVALGNVALRYQLMVLRNDVVQVFAADGIDDRLGEGSG